VTVKDMANAFLNHKTALQDAGELSPRTLAEYKAATDLLVSAFGKDRLVADLDPDDFAALRKRMAKTWRPHRLVKMIQYARSRVQVRLRQARALRAGLRPADQERSAKARSLVGYAVPHLPSGVKTLAPQPRVPDTGGTFPLTPLRSPPMCRSALVPTLLLLLPSTVQAQDNAQKLYEAMEQKLVKAEAYQFQFSIEFQQKGIKVTQKGTFLRAKGNRVKLTVEEHLNGKLTTRKVMVSDGKDLATQQEVNGQQTTDRKLIDENLDAVFTAYLSRGNMMTALTLVPSKTPALAASLLKPSDFRVLGKEKIDGRDAVVIEYKLTVEGTSSMAVFKVWLDAQDNLPLKRSFEAGPVDKGGTRLIETYSAWQIDPKLPDGTFALPK
jgi:outer membrane lipoprotein-sorting protein